MDHALRTISFIADIGDVLVVMVRRCPALTTDTFTAHTHTKICCHVFETDDVCMQCLSIHSLSLCLSLSLSLSLSVYVCVCVMLLVT